VNITIGRKTGDPLRFDSHPNEKVLQAALRNNLAVPYECATGTCGSCRAKLVSGELDQGWHDAPGRKALKTKRGEFLMCQAQALSECEIRIPSSVSENSAGYLAPDHFTGTAANLVQLTGDVISFSVVLDQRISFQAGQFMILQFPGVVGTRAYSMVNFAAQTDQLDFVIKRFTGGACSELLFGESSEGEPLEGRQITVFGPLGHAVFEPGLGQNLLLLAGGSGIAGMMAMLQQADQIGYLKSHKIDLIFGVRSASDIFYLPILRNLADQYPGNLKITIALSEQTGDGTIDQTENLRMTRGFVHELIGDVPADSNTMAFIAGPPLMVNASIRVLIATSGFGVEQIRYDKFA